MGMKLFTALVAILSAMSVLMIWRSEPAPVSVANNINYSPMHKYSIVTKEMVRDGGYEEALERVLWYHEHVLEHEPSAYGVRLSYALSDWKELGELYPPAIAAMENLRDHNTQLLKDGKGNPSLFHDTMAFNRTLEEDSKTIDLFRILDREQEDLAVQCWKYAKDVVIKTRTVDIAKKYLGDPVQEFMKIKAMHDMHAANYGREPFDDEVFKSVNEDSFVERVVRLIGVAALIGESASAREIQEKALAVVDDDRLREALPTP